MLNLLNEIEKKKENLSIKKNRIALLNMIANNNLIITNARLNFKLNACKAFNGLL